MSKSMAVESETPERAPLATPERGQRGRLARPDIDRLADPQTGVRSSDLSRTSQALRRSFLALAVAGLAVAGIVTALTAAEPVKTQLDAWAPGRLADGNECFRVPVAERNGSPGCDLIQLRHPDFGEAHAIPNDPELYGFDPEAGVVLGSYVSTASELHEFRTSKLWTYRPFESDELAGFASSGDDGEATSFTDTERLNQPLAGSDGSRVRSPSVLDALANGPLEIGLVYGYEVVDGANHTYSWPVEDAVLFNGTADEVSEVRIAYDEWTTRWAAPAPPVRSRSLPLAAIWGTALGLLGLIALIGAAVARPLRGVARRSEVNAERSERYATQLEGVLDTAHHKLAREVIQMEYVLDDLDDENPDIDLTEARETLTGIVEGKDVLAEMATIEL